MLEKLTKEKIESLETGQTIFLKNDTMIEPVLYCFYDSKNNEVNVVEYLTESNEPSVYCPELENLYFIDNIEQMCLDAISEFIGR